MYDGESVFVVVVVVVLAALSPINLAGILFSNI